MRMRMRREHGFNKTACVCGGGSRQPGLTRCALGSSYCLALLTQRPLLRRHIPSPSHPVD